MVELEEAVVKMGVLVEGLFGLVVASGDVALGVEVFGADLGDVHINEVSVVAIHLEEFVLSVETIGVNVVADVNVLVGQDVLGLVGWVSGGAHTGDVHVGFFLVLVNSEVEVLF
jgi:hypothetical protein